MRSSKHDTILKIALCIFQLEATKGHLGWKVTELVRKARVSRTLIYRYFGSSKKRILLGALRVFIDDHYGFSDQGTGTSFSERVRISHERMTSNPEVVLFYQKWRGKETWLSDEFRRAERRFQKRLAKIFPGLNEDGSVMVHAFLHGVVTAPFMTPVQAAWACEEFAKRCLSRAPVE